MGTRRLMDRKKREAEWAEAKRRCGLNAETLQMAKELGLNPRSLIRKTPSKSQPWKAPVAVWIRELYRKCEEKAARRRAGREARVAGSGPPRGLARAEGDGNAKLHAPLTMSDDETPVV